jgi:hypothetical protein
MTKEQYDYSNMFWEDLEWTDGLPKYYETADDGETMIFHYLEVEELREFMKIKARENPEVMQDVRYKKLLRILK